MRKILTGICAMMATVCVLPACGKAKDKTVTVTFVQAGQQDIVKTIEKGGSLTDIPEVAEKEGYTIAWERTDFSSLTDSITVNAIETPNQYTITYDANGGSVSSSEQTVTYDAEFALLTPERENAVFQWWYLSDGDENVPFEGGTYTVAGDVELKAKWTAAGVDGEWSENG